VKRWLITTSKDSDLAALCHAIEQHGGTVGEEAPIPLDLGEQVVEAEGPDDLPERLREHPAVRKISPDSPKYPYT
jgi:hypothetical protein